MTLNRLCASGMEAVGTAARAIRAGEMDFAIAGGVESMTRAPFVQGKAQEAFSRSAEIFDTTIGWRFINPLMKQQYGVDSMPETGENVAEEFQVSRADQDAFALRSQQRAGKAMAAGYFAAGDRRRSRCRAARPVPSRSTRTSIRGPTPRSKQLAKLKTPFRNPGTVTAGNASGVNDGAAAMIIASEAAVKAARPDAARAHSRHGVGGGAAAHHGHRPGAGDPQADGAARAQNRRLRFDRDQRSLRLAVA